MCDSLFIVGADNRPIYQGMSRISSLGFQPWVTYFAQKSMYGPVWSKSVFRGWNPNYTLWLFSLNLYERANVVYLDNTSAITNLEASFISHSSLDILFEKLNETRDIYLGKC